MALSDYSHPPVTYQTRVPNFSLIIFHKQRLCFKMGYKWMVEMGFGKLFIFPLLFCLSLKSSSSLHVAPSSSSSSSSTFLILWLKLIPLSYLSAQSNFKFRALISLSLVYWFPFFFYFHWIIVSIDFHCIRQLLYLFFAF